MILDGWGKSPDPKISAVDQAHTPYIDSLSAKYPSAELRTDGLNVGLPEGQMGNSEVGHMNLGAGRIIYQDLVKINLAVENKTLGKEPVLIAAMEFAKQNNKPVHLMGLLSDGGVHSHIDHLKGLIDVAESYNLPNVFVHAFTDGRDVDPHSGVHFVEEIQEYIKNKSAKIATIIGRYFAMDRDHRWERVKKAYDLLVRGEGARTNNPIAALKMSYANGVTDEFVEPIVVVDDKDEAVATIKSGDVVIFFNFRTDRGRQLTDALTQTDHHEQNMHKLDLFFVTMTDYDHSFKNIMVIYEKDNLNETLGEVLSKNHKKQLRIAETEKYPHVTFFFSGGQEIPFAGETRILKDSPKVATYDLQPEMSAYLTTDALVPVLESESVDFVCLNFANGDMVGHTGNFAAAVKACEAVDRSVERVVTAALAHGYTTIMIADHGNCETMVNADGSPNTAHTTNPVPIVIIDPEIKTVKNGLLADVAPTILKLMGVEQPKIMDRHSLV